MRIKIEFQGPGFVAVPNHVAAMVGQLIGDLVGEHECARRQVPDAVRGERFAASDLGALVVLATLPVGSEWSAVWAQKRLGIGRDAWQAMSRRLRAVGALSDDVVTGEDGCHRGRGLSVRWPEQTEVAGAKNRRKARGGAKAWQHRMTGKPNDGKPGIVGPGKPNDGKPGIRSVEVIENEQESGGEVCENPSFPKTKTDGDAAAPSALAAASPSGADPDTALRVDMGALTEFERSRLRDGKSVMIGSEFIQSGSDRSRQLWLAVLSWQSAKDAEKGGRL